MSAVLEVEAFANQHMADASAGYRTDSMTPAMTTPVTYSVAIYVIQGSTICLIC